MWAEKARKPGSPSSTGLPLFVLAAPRDEHADDERLRPQASLRTASYQPAGHICSARAPPPLRNAHPVSHATAGVQCGGEVKRTCR